MHHLKKLLLIVFFAVIVFTACNTNSVKFTSVDEFGKWLSEQLENTADAPYSVKLKVSDISSVNDVLKRNENKFISLDLSDSSLAYVKMNAFNCCFNLTGITIPNSVTIIGDKAFYGCTKLTNITIPNSVTSIEDGAFWGCINLTNITIPNSVTEIGNFAFTMCYSLSSVTIPNSITHIAASTFSDCTSITRIIIPNSVTNIDWSAFADCTRLTSVTFEGTIIKENFSDYDGTFPGDLRDKFYATDETNGTPGTYTREINGSLWTRK